MFYIEKNDKLGWLERKLKLIKVQENTIILPIDEDIKEKQIEKIAKKTKKIIQKNSNRKKIILSKKMQEQQTYINYLNTYGIEIQNGKWLYEILLPNITEYILEKKNVEKVNISNAKRNVTIKKSKGKRENVWGKKD